MLLSIDAQFVQNFLQGWLVGAVIRKAMCGKRMTIWFIWSTYGETTTCCWLPRADKRHCVTVAQRWVEFLKKWFDFYKVLYNPADAI